MRVYLPRLALNQWTDLRVDELELLAARDRFRTHELVDGPAEADVVLFVQCHMVDWRLRAIREHPVAKSHWAKVMVYDERDRPWRSFPGVYVSAPSSDFDPRRQRAWSYLRVPPAEPPVAAEPEPDLLFSFVGSPTHDCREPLFALRHPDSVVEEVRDFMFWDPASKDFEARRRRYRQILARSRFVLCPRGRGTSSFRLYETLAAGRVPVIISDDWVAPPDQDWESFSLRIPEDGTRLLVGLLEEHSAHWRDMSEAAAVAYREFFGDEVAFHRIVEQLRDLRESSCPRSSPWVMRRCATSAALREHWATRRQARSLRAR